MIQKLFRNSHMLTQTPASDCDIANDAVGVSVDALESIIVSQNGAHVVIDKNSVPEFITLLRKMVAFIEKEAKDGK